MYTYIHIYIYLCTCIQMQRTIPRDLLFCRQSIWFLNLRSCTKQHTHINQYISMNIGICLSMQMDFAFEQLGSLLFDKSHNGTRMNEHISVPRIYMHVNMSIYVYTLSSIDLDLRLHTMSRMSIYPHKYEYVYLHIYIYIYCRSM